LKRSELFEGLLAQVSDVHPSHPVAVNLSCLPEETIKQMTSLNAPDDMDSKESFA